MKIFLGVRTNSNALIELLKTVSIHTLKQQGTSNYFILRCQFLLKREYKAFSDSEVHNVLIFAQWIKRKHLNYKEQMRMSGFYY